MNKFYVSCLLLMGLLAGQAALAEKEDDLRMMMRDANGAIQAMAFEDAISFCDQAIALNPEFAEAYATRSMVRAMMEEMDGALEDAKKAIELAPDSASIHSAYYVRAAIALDYAAEPDKALEFINKAIEFKNNDAGYYELRGDIYSKLGNQELADADYAKSDAVVEE